MMSSSGGLLSAVKSYDPNFPLSKQPQLSFSWTCGEDLDLSTTITSQSELEIPSGLLLRVTCTVTVVSKASSRMLYSSATASVIPVSGSPPSLDIAASASRVSLHQSLVLSVVVKSGNFKHYSFQWSASPKPIAESDADSSLQASSVAIKPGFFDASSQRSAVFKCRASHILTGVYAEASISVALNDAPDCSIAVPLISSESCIGSIGSVCTVTALTTKLRVMLADEFGGVSGCMDADGPMSYRLLAFRSACTATSAGQLLAVSSSPMFTGITVASGVSALGLEAVDALGAVSRVCSSEFSVSNATAASILSLLRSNSHLSSLSGDQQSQQRFAANVALSLSTLHSSTLETDALADIKESTFAYLDASSLLITDPSSAAQTAFTLFELVSLPGPISTASSSAAANMFQKVASSTLALLNTGAATRDLAVEISSMLVAGSTKLLKTASEPRGRHLLGIKSGMISVLAAVQDSARVQVHALVASQSAVLHDQSPSAVVGIRRLSSSPISSTVVPSSSSFRISVAVAPDVDANDPRDVGISVVILASSPFTTVNSTTLISPTLSIEMFDAVSGNSLSSGRSEITAVFPVTQASHDVRVVQRSDGSRLSEQCVVYDGSKWLLACTLTPFSSASAVVECLCNATQQHFHVALAEFTVDCKGTVGGFAVFDSCKTCGGNIMDASLCVPIDSTSFPIWAVIALSVGAAIFIAVGIFIVKVRKLRRLARTKPVTAIDVVSKDGTLSSLAKPVSFITEFSPSQIPPIPMPPPRSRIRPAIRASRATAVSPDSVSALSQTPSAVARISPRDEDKQQQLHQQPRDIVSDLNVAVAQPPVGLPRTRRPITNSSQQLPGSGLRLPRKPNVPDGFTSSEDISPVRVENLSPHRSIPASIPDIRGSSFALPVSNLALPASNNASRYARLLQTRLQALTSDTEPMSTASRFDLAAGVSSPSLSPPEIYRPSVAVSSTSNLRSNASRYATMLAQRASRIQGQQAPIQQPSTSHVSAEAPRLRLSSPNVTPSSDTVVRTASFFCRC
jgi:hypothetical protein